jgi:hypothetical protein
MLNFRYFNIILLPAILFLASYLLFGFYFETNDDLVMSLLLRGDLQPQGGFAELSKLFLFKIALIYHFLYQIIPSLPWYGLSLLFFNFIACINIFYITDKLLTKYFNKYFITIILTCFYFIIFIENNIEINYSRTSIMLAGSSLMLIFLNLTKDIDVKLNKFVIVQFILLIISLLIRPMGGFLSSLIVSPAIIFFAINSNKTRKLFYYLVSVYIIILMLYSYTQFIKPVEEKTYLDNLLKVANFMDFGIDNTEDKINLQDSIKRQAVKNLFISDTKIINTEFLDKISSSNLFSINKIIPVRIKSAVIYSALTAFKYYPGVTLFYLFTFVIIIYVNYKKIKYDFIFVLFIQFIFIMAVLSISVLMKLPDRVFFPLAGLMITCNIFLLNFSDFSFSKNKIKTYSAVFLVLSAVISYPAMNSRYSQLCNLNHKNKECFSLLDKNYGGTTFLITQPSYTLFDGSSSLENFSMQNNKTFPLIGWNTILPSYVLDLKKICSSADINDFFNYLKNNNSYVLISNDKFNMFLINYFKIFYNNDLKFIQIDEPSEILKKRDLYLYKIESY